MARPRPSTNKRKTTSANRAVTNRETTSKTATGNNQPSGNQKIIQKARLRYERFLARRPHRSFQRSQRRDYARSLDIPGYWSFSLYVIKTIFSQKKLFGSLLLFYVVAGVLLVGLASQDTYSQLSTLLDSTTDDWTTLGQAGLLLVTSLAGGLNVSLTEAQQIYSVLLLLLIWLAVVWALRGILTGNVPRLRDALYNSGAPIVSTTIVLLLIVIQLVPVALAVVIVNAAIGTGMFDSPTMSLIISLVAAGLGLVSIYWITSSIIALVVVTLPGMYPWQAIQSAGDLVIGRRMRILLRLCWMFVSSLVFSVLVLLPIIVLDRVIKQVIPAIEWVPIVPVSMALLSAAILIWCTSYVYLLYRKIVEDDAKPA